TALDVPVRFLHGNGERVVAASLSGGDISEVPEAYRDVIRWTADQLTADQRRAIAGWPPTQELEVAGVGRTLFCHATPRNHREIFTGATPEERLAPVFAGVTASVVVCGHTHMQFDRTVGKLRVVNAGSVGMPFQSPRGAYWLLLDADVQLRRTEYDFEAAAEALGATTSPQGEALAVRYVLNPPSESETVQMYARAELT